MQRKKTESGKSLSASARSKRRRNKILMALGALMLLGMLGMFGLWRFYRYYQNPQRFIRRARELTEQGEHTAALDQYQRALRRTPSAAGRAEILVAMAVNIAAEEPAPPQDVQESSRTLLGLQADIFRLADSKDEPARIALGNAFFMAEHLESPSTWGELRQVAQLVSRLQDDNLQARKYLVVARLFLRPREDRTERFHNEIQEEFEQLREAGLQDDGELVYYQALALARRAGQIDQEYLEDRRREWYGRAVEMLDEYLGEHPEDELLQVRRLRIAMQRLLDTRDRGYLAEFVEQVETLWGRMEEVVPGSEIAAVELAHIYYMLSHFAAGRVSEMEGLFVFDQEEMQRRAFNLLEQVAGFDIPGLRALTLMARMQRGLGQKEQAMATIQRVLDPGIVFSPGVEAVVAWSYQLQMRFMRLDLWLEEYEETDEKGLLAKVEEELAKLEERLGEDSPHLKSMIARFAYLQGDYRRAVAAFAEADQALGQTPQSLLFSGLSWARLGETGQAVQKLGEYLRNPGQSMGQRRQALEALVMAMLRMRRFEDAVLLGRRMFEEQPEWDRARLVMAQVLLVRGRFAPGGVRPEVLEEAEQLLQPLVAASHPEAMQQQAVLYLQTNRAEETVAMLNDYVHENPGSAWANYLLYSALRNQGEDAEATALLQRTVEFTEDSRIRQYLEAAIDGDQPWPNQSGILLQLALQPDQVERQIGVYQLLSQMQLTSEAEEVLENLSNQAPNHQQVLQLQFNRALGQQEWEQAAKVIERAAMQPETKRLSEILHARLDLARRESLAAVSRLQRMVEADEADSQVLFLLGIAHEQRGDLSQAQQVLEQALARRPDNVDVVRNLITVSAARGFNYQAMQYMQHALQLAPEDQQLVRTFLNYLEQFESSEQALQLRLRMAEMHPDDRDNLLHVANLYLRNRQFEEAARLLQDLRSGNPDDFSAVLLTARMHAMTDRIEQGRELLEAFLQRRGDLAGTVAWTQYAQFLQQTGARRETVSDALERARQLEDDRQPIGSRYLAEMLMQENRPEEALPLLADLYERSNDHQLLLMMAEANLMRENHRQALSLIDTFVREHRFTGQSGLLMARAQSAAGQPREALNTLDRVINMAPGLAQAHFQKAQLLWSHSELSRDGATVRRSLERALEVDPHYAEARFMLVGWSWQNNRPAEAIDHLTRLLVRHPLNTQYRAMLAQLYLSEGQYRRMREMLDEWEKLAADTDHRQASVLANLWRARMERAMGRQQEALDLFAAVYEQAPGDVNVFNEYLDMLLSLEHRQTVVEMVADADEAVRGNPTVQIRAGQALAAVGRDEEAMMAFLEAFTKGRAEPRFQYQVLERAWRNLRDEERWNELLSMVAPYDGEGLVQLIRAVGDYEEGRWQEASRRLARVRGQLNPDSPVYVRSLILLAAAYSKQQLHQRAEEVLSEAMRATPDDPVLLNNLAYEVARIGDDPFRAVELAEKALTLITEENVEVRAHILDTLGYAQHKAGLSAHAETTLQRSLRLKALPSAYLNLGRVYMHQNRPREALEALRQALETAPETEAELIGEANELIRQARSSLELVGQ